jgi:hypothetical protein
VKFAPDDRGHKAFRRGVEDVAAIKADRYKSAADLPARLAEPASARATAWAKGKPALPPGR